MIFGIAQGRTHTGRQRGNLGIASFILNGLAQFANFLTNGTTVGHLAGRELNHGILYGLVRETVARQLLTHHAAHELVHRFLTLFRRHITKIRAISAWATAARAIALVTLVIIATAGIAEGPAPRLR
jgi:hypothetical protein